MEYDSIKKKEENNSKKKKQKQKTTAKQNKKKKQKLKNKTNRIPFQINNSAIAENWGP